MEILVCHKILERGYDYYAEGRTYGMEVARRKRVGHSTCKYSVFRHTMYHVQIVVGRDSIESLNLDKITEGIFIGENTLKEAKELILMENSKYA